MDRQASERRGRRAETIAAWWLAAKGYRVLARRAATPWGEIDLVCRQGACVVFVEVKARQSVAAALESLGPRQRRRIADAARHYIGRHPPLSALDCRFDLVAIGRFGLPHHLVNAWTPGAF
ncbi:MAG: YraN family protein [Geminicoccaceae bacterium]|nr:YraN family protein [Geminicoccaceae bacterium]HRY25838.1 YraN family protein [Geminicoccaceae bacterium]